MFVLPRTSHYKSVNSFHSTNLFCIRLKKKGAVALEEFAASLGADREDPKCSRASKESEIIAGGRGPETSSDSKHF